MTVTTIIHHAGVLPAIATILRVSESDLVYGPRSRSLVDRRQIAMWMLSRRGWSCQRIADAMNRDKSYVAEILRAIRLDNPGSATALEHLAERACMINVAWDNVGERPEPTATDWQIRTAGIHIRKAVKAHRDAAKDTTERIDHAPAGTPAGDQTPPKSTAPPPTDARQAAAHNLAIAAFETAAIYLRIAGANAEPTAASKLRARDREILNHQTLLAEAIVEAIRGHAIATTGRDLPAVKREGKREMRQ